MSLFENLEAPALLPPSCVEHFKGKKPTCNNCSKQLGVDRSPVAGLGKWYCGDWCRTTKEKGVGALSFDERSGPEPEEEPTPDWDPNETDTPNGVDPDEDELYERAEQLGASLTTHDEEHDERVRAEFNVMLSAVDADLAEELWDVFHDANIMRLRKLAKAERVAKRKAVQG